MKWMVVLAYITFTVTMGFLVDFHIASFEKLRSEPRLSETLDQSGRCLDLRDTNGPGPPRFIYKNPKMVKLDRWAWVFTCVYQIHLSVVCSDLK